MSAFKTVLKVLALIAFNLIGLFAFIALFSVAWPFLLAAGIAFGLWALTCRKL